MLYSGKLVSIDFGVTTTPEDSRITAEDIERFREGITLEVTPPSLEDIERFREATKKLFVLEDINTRMRGRWL